MSRYRRPNIEGGTFFFTVVLADRSSALLVQHIECLRQVYRAVQLAPAVRNGRNLYPAGPSACEFGRCRTAMPILPHAGARSKAGFSREVPAAQLKSRSQVRRRETGIWQRRFWEHAIRDDTDFERHVDYIHFNPVKHGYVTRVCDWPYSSFHRYVKDALLPADWGGDMAEIAGRFGE